MHILEQMFIIKLKGLYVCLVWVGDFLTFKTILDHNMNFLVKITTSMVRKN